MTQAQFEQMVISCGGSQREAELIAALVYPEWQKLPATKLTRKQWQDIRTLLFDRREEDKEQAYITHAWAINHEHAGYLVRWKTL